MSEPEKNSEPPQAVQPSAESHAMACIPLAWRGNDLAVLLSGWGAETTISYSELLTQITDKNVKKSHDPVAASCR